MDCRALSARLKETSLEGLSILAVIRNTIQLAQLAIRTVSEFRQRRRDAGGSSGEVTTQAIVTSHLAELLKRVPVPDETANAGLTPSAETEAFRASGEECTKIVDEMQKLLQPLGFKGRPNIWKYLRVTWRAATTKQERADLLARLQLVLDAVDCQIAGDTLRRLIRMESDQKAALESIKSDLKKVADKVLANPSRFGGNSQSISFFEAKATELVKNEQELFRQLAKGDQKILGAIKSLRSQLAGMLQAQKVVRERNRLLGSLTYPNRYSQHESIERPYRNTFEWIFEEEWPTKTGYSPWDLFVPWLSSQEGAYWIRGKEGSGKSTLMSFICAHQQTKVHLQQWADGQSLVIASFFFSKNDSDLQRGPADMLRSLLHQCLTQMEDLIPRCLGTAQDFPNITVWWESLVREAFQRLLEQIPNDTKLCFFIDGLNQFVGDTQQLLDDLERLSRLARVKICVSSRPLPKFMRAFHHLSQMSLQDLNRSDLATVGHEIYLQHESAPIHASPEAYPRELVQLVLDISDRAKGVFTWVKLVTESLWDGIRCGHDEQTLRASFDICPPQVNAMYERMSKSLGEVEKGKTLRLFGFVRAAGDDCQLLDCFLAQDIYPEETSAWMDHCASLSNLQMQLAAYARVICERSAGLLMLQCERRIEQHVWAPDEQKAVTFEELAQTKVIFFHHTAERYLDKLEQPPLLSQANTLLKSLVLSAEMKWPPHIAVRSLCRRFAKYFRVQAPDRFTVEDVQPLVKITEEFGSIVSRRASKETVVSITARLLQQHDCRITQPEQCTSAAGEPYELVVQIREQCDEATSAHYPIHFDLLVLAFSRSFEESAHKISPQQWSGTMAILPADKMDQIEEDFTCLKCPEAPTAVARLVSAMTRLLEYSKTQSPHVHWSNAMDWRGIVRTRPYNPAEGVPILNASFLDFCAECWHTLYVDACLRSIPHGPERSRLSQRLLCFTFKRLNPSDLTWELPIPQMEILLAAGAEPNLRYQKCESSWQLWLKLLRDFTEPYIDQDIVYVTKLLLKFGADVKCQIEPRSLRPGEKAKEGFARSVNVADIVRAWVKKIQSSSPNEYVWEMQDLIWEYGAEDD